MIHQLLTDNEILTIIQSACSVRGHTKDHLLHLIRFCEKLRTKQLLLDSILQGHLNVSVDPNDESGEPLISPARSSGTPQKSPE